VVAYGVVKAVGGRSAAVLLCVAGVPLLVVTLVHVFFGVPLSAYRPVINDEVAYWHQALTFARAGFHGGYYTLGEVTNPSGLTPFGPHGPGFAVLYGTAGALFGWYRHTAVILNLLAIGSAAWIWASLTRASIVRLLLGAAMLLTFWHMLFWASSGMQESLHHAGAIAIAGCFAAVLGADRRWWIIGFGWVVLAVLAFVRPSWLVLFPLWAIATTRSSSRRVVAATVVASIAIGTVILFAYSRMTAPYEEGFFFLRAGSLSLGLQALVENVTGNVQRLGMPDQFNRLELLHRYQYGALLLATTTAAVATMWRRRQAQDLSPHFAIAASALALALAAMILLYQFTNFAEHRVLSAFLLFGTMLCIAAPGRIGPALATGIVLVSVVSARPSLIEIEDSWRDRFVWDRRPVSELEGALEATVVYHPDASRWCNTLLTSQYPPQLIGVPAGIGLSVVRKPERMTLPPKSRYLLLDEDVRAAFTGPLNLDMVATLPYGTLYVNRDADCGALAENGMMLQTKPSRADGPRVSVPERTLCEAVVSFGARKHSLARASADNSCRASGGPPFLVEPVTSRDF